jgi:hypothetical protein
MAAKCDISLLGENKCLRKNYKKYTFIGLHNAGQERNRKMNTKKYSWLDLAPQVATGCYHED